MKKKLLVVGDSFMHPDHRYPDQHWSEMLPEYEILMYSVSGSSNSIIARNFFQGLTQRPDAVVLGFTMNNRLEFCHQPSGEWIGSVMLPKLTSDQKIAAEYYLATSDENINLFKSCVLARSLLLTCEKLNMPYAYTLNQMFNNLATLPYPSAPEVIELLGEFSHRMCPTNLATYPHFTMHPGFHTDNPEWQKRFAKEVVEILSQPLT